MPREILSTQKEIRNLLDSRETIEQQKFNYASYKRLVKRQSQKNQSEAAVRDTILGPQGTQLFDLTITAVQK